MESSTHFERGRMLLAQDRYKQAEESFALALAEEPQNADCLCMLALCQILLKRVDDALASVKEALKLAPDNDFPHRILAIAMLSKGRNKEAGAAIEEAVRLDPENAANWREKARLLILSKDWKEALACAERALSFDPDEQTCRNFRATALQGLGMHDAAAEASEDALRKNPEDASAHAVTGWGLLHKGQAREALNHFAEALRIEPDNDSARAGLVESLKARNFVYAVILRYFLWVDALKERWQWGLTVGLVVGVQLIKAVGSASPSLAPAAAAVGVCYFFFVYTLWLSSPLFDLTLFLHPLGRYALSRAEKAVSLILAADIVLSTVAATAIAKAIGRFEFYALVIPYLSAFPLLMACRAASGWKRLAAILYLSVVLAAGVASLFMPPEQFMNFFNVYLWGCVLATWISSLFR